MYSKYLSALPYTCSYTCPNLFEGKLIIHIDKIALIDTINPDLRLLVSNFASSENDLLPVVTIGSYYPVHIDPQNKCLNYFLYHHVLTSLVIEG